MVARLQAIYVLCPVPALSPILSSLLLLLVAGWRGLREQGACWEITETDKEEALDFTRSVFLLIFHAANVCPATLNSYPHRFNAAPRTARKLFYGKTTTTTSASLIVFLFLSTRWQRSTGLEETTSACEWKSFFPLFQHGSECERVGASWSHWTNWQRRRRGKRCSPKGDSSCSAPLPQVEKARLAGLLPSDVSFKMVHG